MKTCQKQAVWRAQPALSRLSGKLPDDTRKLFFSHFKKYSLGLATEDSCVLGEREERR